MEQTTPASQGRSRGPVEVDEYTYEYTYDDSYVSEETMPVKKPKPPTRKGEIHVPLSTSSDLSPSSELEPEPKPKVRPDRPPRSLAEPSGKNKKNQRHNRGRSRSPRRVVVSGAEATVVVVQADQKQSASDSPRKGSKRKRAKVVAAAAEAAEASVVKEESNESRRRRRRRRGPQEALGDVKGRSVPSAGGSGSSRQPQHSAAQAALKKSANGETRKRKSTVVDVRAEPVVPEADLRSRCPNEAQEELSSLSGDSNDNTEIQAKASESAEFPSIYRRVRMWRLHKEAGGAIHRRGL